MFDQSTQDRFQKCYGVSFVQVKEHLNNANSISITPNPHIPDKNDPHWHADGIDATKADQENIKILTKW